MNLSVGPAAALGAAPPTMFSSQNAALVQFKIRTPGEGFAFRVSFVQNPDRELELTPVKPLRIFQRQTPLQSKIGHSFGVKNSTECHSK